MVFQKITQSDLAGKGVVGLPDTPGLSTSEMQRRFDQLSTEVVVPAFNALAQQLDALALDACMHSENIKAMRLNADNQLELTMDGEGWQPTGSEGHLVEIAPDFTGVLPIANGGTGRTDGQLDATLLFAATLLADGWVQSDGAYTQTVPCTDMQADYNTEPPFVLPTGVQETDAALADALGSLCEGGNHGQTLDGQISWTMYNTPPTADITICLRRAQV